MSVRREASVIHLEGDCPVDEAEALAAILEREGPVTVDLSRCRRLHSALAQALLRFRPPIAGLPDDPFLRNVVMPSLRTERV